MRCHMGTGRPEGTASRANGTTSEVAAGARRRNNSMAGGWDAPPCSDSRCARARHSDNEPQCNTRSCGILVRWGGQQTTSVAGQTSGTNVPTRVNVAVMEAPLPRAACPGACIRVLTTSKGVNSSDVIKLPADADRIFLRRLWSGGAAEAACEGKKEHEKEHAMTQASAGAWAGCGEASTSTASHLQRRNEATAATAHTTGTRGGRGGRREAAPAHETHHDDVTASIGPLCPHFTTVQSLH